MKIYLASSWRNVMQQSYVNYLRDDGHEVYDFKNPAPGNNGFGWREIDPHWKTWDATTFRSSLTHPIANAGFQSDFYAMHWADPFVLLAPCGRSAHLEMGWACGAGKHTCIVLNSNEEPELMYKMADHIAIGLFECIDWLRTLTGPKKRGADTPVCDPIIEQNTCAPPPGLSVRREGSSVIVGPGSTILVTVEQGQVHQ